MNELMNAVHVEYQDGIFVVSSLDVADRFGKQHNHILRDIERLREDVSNFGQMFFEGSYSDGYGRMQRCYTMNRDGFSILAMGFTGTEALSWKLKFIEAFNALEREWNSPEKTIARALVLANRELEHKTQQLLEMAPKAEFYDAVADSRSAISVAEAAKVLGIPGMGQNKLFQTLREMGLLMSNNQPYQEYIERGYFRVIEQRYQKPDGSTMVSPKTLVYQKGLDYIRRKVQEGHGPNC